jgi:FkbM family methyltransferase
MERPPHPAGVSARLRRLTIAPSGSAGFPGLMSTSETKALQTRHGPMLALAADSYITRSLELYGEFSPGEWDLFDQIVRRGMTVVEAGANIGAHTVPLARRCAPGRLHAFEPQQRVFQILCANLALNGVGNVLAYPEACAAEAGVVVLPELDYSRGGNYGGVSVQAADSAGLKVTARRSTAADRPCATISPAVNPFPLAADSVLER